MTNEEILPAELDFFLRFPITPHVTSPVDFLSNNSWGGVRTLSQKDEFRYVSQYFLKKNISNDKINRFFLGVSIEISKHRVKDGKNSSSRIVRKGKNYPKNGKTKRLCKDCV